MARARVTRWRLVACALGVLAGCNAVLGIEDVTVVDALDDGAAPPRDGNPPDVVVDGNAPVDAGADVQLDAAPDVAPPPQPNPACLIADRDDPKTMITFSDNPGSTTKPLGVEVRDQDRPLANVNIQLCTPASPTPIVNASATVLGGPPFRWSWDAGLLPRGVTQVTFRADPNATTVYETTRIEVR
jgi:hypothetical protein